MWHHIFLSAHISLDQTSPHMQLEQPTQSLNSIILRGLWRHVWVNMLILSPQGTEYGYRYHTTCFYIPLTHCLFTCVIQYAIQLFFSIHSQTILQTSHLTTSDQETRLMKNSVPRRTIYSQSYPVFTPQSYSLRLQPLSQTHHLPAPDRETQSVNHSVPSTIGCSLHKAMVGKWWDMEGQQHTRRSTEGCTWQKRVKAGYPVSLLRRLIDVWVDKINVGWSLNSHSFSSTQT